MGHCAEDRGATLLSLRERRKMDDGDIYWEPHVTASLFPDGSVGQIKGKENSKPKEEYWDFILRYFYEVAIPYGEANWHMVSYIQELIIEYEYFKKFIFC